MLHLGDLCLPKPRTRNSPMLRTIRALRWHARPRGVTSHTLPIRPPCVRCACLGTAAVAGTHEMLSLMSAPHHYACLSPASTPLRAVVLPWRRHSPLRKPLHAEGRALACSWCTTCSTQLAASSAVMHVLGSESAPSKARNQSLLCITRHKRRPPKTTTPRALACLDDQ